MNDKKKVVIVGAGFTGLSAAVKLVKNDQIDVEVIDLDDDVGGLAGGFDQGNTTIEKFYHHWFASDRYINELIEYLDCEDNVVLRPTKTGMYYANNFYNLSSPIDLLKFKAISLPARIRLGISVVLVRAIKDWKKIEHLTAYQWLKKLCGKEAFNVVWKPLLDGKFGPFAEKVGAVWFWKKITLRGGSRSKDGREVLQYYKGGFLSLARHMSNFIKDHGGKVSLSEKIETVEKQDSKYLISTNKRQIEADSVLFTPAPEVVAKLLTNVAEKSYTDSLNRINYLANLCMVLELDRSLSDIYWLNVNDPDFPFVGIIEHTNFEPASSYDGRHLVYLSKYLPATDELYHMSKDELLAFVLPYIKRMFPEFSEEWILNWSVWKADYAQPVMEPGYSDMMPKKNAPLDGIYLANMAQIYPEDRGTNYAVRDGFDIVKDIEQYLGF